MGSKTRRDNGTAAPAAYAENAEEGATSAPETAWDALGAELEEENEAWGFGNGAVDPARDSEVGEPEEDEEEETEDTEEEDAEDSDDEEETEDDPEAEDDEEESEESEEDEEEEETEEEPEERGLPKAAIKAIQKARKRAQAAEAELNEAKPRLQAMEGELVQLRAAKVVPQATPENPLAEYDDPETLAGFEQRMQDFRDWLDLNPDGGEYTWPNGQKWEVEPEQVRNYQVQLRRDLERNIPARKEYFAKRAGVDAHLEKLYPVLKDPTHPLSVGINRALAAMPELKRNHTARADALLYTLGAELVTAFRGREGDLLQTLERLKKGQGASDKGKGKKALRKPAPGVKAKPVPVVRGSRGPKRTKPKAAGNRAGATSVLDEIDVSDWEAEL